MRQGKQKGGTFAGLAFHPDFATMEIDDPSGDGQSQSAAGRTPLGCIFYLSKFLEYQGLILRADTDSIVGNLDGNDLMIHTQSHINMAIDRLTEFDGI